MIRKGWVAMAMAALTLSACGDDGVTPPAFPLAEIAGSWTAEGAFGALVFTTRTGGEDEEVDWLSRGGSIVLDLGMDLRTAGRIFLPGLDEEEGDFDEDLKGTWTAADNRVNLDHAADTFLRNMVLVRDGNVLKGEATFDDVTVRLVLARR